MDEEQAPSPRAAALTRAESATGFEAVTEFSAGIWHGLFWPGHLANAASVRNCSRRVVARVLLWPNAMLNLAEVSPLERTQALRFAASFLWADLHIADAERRFLSDLAKELDVSAEIDELLACPPIPEEIDPNEVTPATAALIRDVALRAIASDGAVKEEEMAMFDVLDELLPK